MELQVKGMSAVGYSEGTSPSPVGGNLAVDAVLLQAVANALDVPAAKRGSGLSAWRLKRVDRYIHENLSRPITVAELAAVAKLSPGHFTRCFGISAGMSPHAYLIVRRMDLARTLMVNTRRSLLEIALECGLADQAHLCRLFRRRAGTTPSQWRREALAAQRMAA